MVLSRLHAKNQVSIECFQNVCFPYESPPSIYHSCYEIFYTLLQIQVHYSMFTTQITEGILISYLG